MNKDLSDSELIQLFHGLDTRDQAFHCIVLKYQQKLYFQIRRYVPDHADADDVLQEVFIKVWKNLNQFREDSQLYTWLFRIAYNESISFIRRQKIGKHADINDYENSFGSHVSGGAELSSNQIQNLLAAAMEELPDKQKLVFHLKYFDQMKYEEMSQQLGTSVGALKASYHLAVKKIEDFLTRG
jgi:RNA polymerase sigma factor (sigma-70 family)